jgi:hypothetical protein
MLFSLCACEVVDKQCSCVVIDKVYHKSYVTHRRYGGFHRKVTHPEKYTFVVYNKDLDKKLHVVTTQQNYINTNIGDTIIYSYRTVELKNNKKYYNELNF